MIRPLIIFDFEATGTDPATAKIVQIAVTKRSMKDGLISESSYEILINPGIAIPEDSTKIHGVTNEMVVDSKKFADIAQTLLSYFKGCDLAGYNIIGYDIPLLSEEFARCGIAWNPYTQDISIMDSMKQFFKDFPRDLSSCYKHYSGKDLKNAHNATADVNATAFIFDKQVEASGIQTLVDNSKVEFYEPHGKIAINKDGIPVLNFTEKKGTPIKDLDKGMARWLYTKPFIPQSVKTLIKEIRHEGQ